MIPFGSWLPDQPTLLNDYASVADNVIPHEIGYHPFPQWQQLIANLGEIPLSSQFFVSSAGIIYNFIGTATKLYVITSAGTAFDDVSRTSGGAYAVPTNGFWTFSQFDDIIYAENGLDVAQKYTMGTSTDFANIAYPSGPPIAKFTATIRRFSVAAHTTTNKREVAWSGLVDPTTFTPSATTLSDSQIIPDGGDITGLVGGDYGVLFQQYAIKRIVFAGPPTTFNFEPISETLGCIASRSIVKYGDLVFFYSSSGVKMIRGAQEIADIGDGKVDDWIHDNVLDLNKMNGAIYPEHKLYALSVQAFNTGSYCDTILLYHWPTGKWAKINYNHYLITNIIPQRSYNLDTVDTLIGSNIDTSGISLDSPSLISTGTMHLAAFDTSYNLGTFEGTPMAATLTTGDIAFTRGRKSLLRRVRPIINADNVGNITITPFVHDKLTETPIAKDAALMNRNGICPIRASGRYHRLQLDIPSGGDWMFALGLDDILLSEMAP